MNDHSTAPRWTERLAAATLCVVVFIALLVGAMLAMEANGAAPEKVLSFGRMFTYGGFGVAVIGWRWPASVLHPIAWLWEWSTTGLIQSLGRALVLPAQRAIFAVGCLGLIPWFCMRAIGELARSEGVRDYMRSAFVRPIAPWFEGNWWWYTKPEWYDWPVLPSMILLVLAYSWPSTVGRLLRWIRGADR